MSAWWHDFFDDDYADYGLASADPLLVGQMADFIVRTLQLSAGQTLFDQCCGIGRLSLPLAERGVHVVGVDRVPSYVHRAARESSRRNLPCDFHCADAFTFVAPHPCDAAINWFTSFGYLEDDDQNIRMMQRSFESLKPGGRFMMDYQNVARTLSDFKPAIIDRPQCKNDSRLAGVMIIQENRPDFMHGMMDSEWTIIHPDGRKTVRNIATRMYMPNDLVRMLNRTGFIEPQLFGWIDGEALSRASRRCIVTARKPA